LAGSGQVRTVLTCVPYTQDLREGASVVAAGDWSAFEWLLVLGWQVQLEEAAGAIRGRATRRVHGEVVEIEASAETIDELVWSLMSRAATELERCNDGQDAAAAA